MPDDLDKLVALSDFYGSNPDFVLAGGGNTSVKIGDRLYVKASGIPLAGITRDGFVAMDRANVRITLTKRYSRDSAEREEQVKGDLLAARCEPEKGLRPSVETTLHEMMEYRFVVHTHATLVNGMTCGNAGKEIAGRLFRDELVWVNYCDPGYTLAKKVEVEINSYRASQKGKCPQIIFLENHGLVVGGNQPAEIRRLHDQVVATLSGHVRRKIPALPLGKLTIRQVVEEELPGLVNHIAPFLRGLLSTEGTMPCVSFNGSDSVREFVSTEAGRTIAKAGPFNPDQIVYCKPFPLWLRNNVSAMASAVEGYRNRYGYAPKVVLVEGVGLFAAADSKASADTLSLVYEDAIKVSRLSGAFGGPHVLTKREWQFIDNWEVESYRRNVAAQSAAASRGRVQGKVALVTGAAQGFGEGIARHLAGEGASVVIADMNCEKAQEVAASLVSQYGNGRTLAVKVNVTDAESVWGMVAATVKEFGGIDLLISNAGVLRAGSVKSMSLSDFDLVTKVNYTGYFLCVKHVAAVMAAQHAADPSYMADIIQINSKSGLQGSNKNSAYAGSKFGGIGLTQSFALELIEDGIKVNAICPGNFFDGPLWSDPETGLFVQYLRTGKVPGAKTVEEVRKAYEEKVPMGRGCGVEDVMRAIYSITEQRYETGQAVPVTGGQVMR